MNSLSWDRVVKDLENLLKPKIHIEQYNSVWFVHIDGEEEVLDWCDKMLESNVFDIKYNAYIFHTKHEAEKFKTLFYLKWQ